MRHSHQNIASVCTMALALSSFSPKMAEAAASATGPARDHAFEFRVGTPKIYQRTTLESEVNLGQESFTAGVNLHHNAKPIEVGFSLGAEHTFFETSDETVTLSGGAFLARNEGKFAIGPSLTVEAMPKTDEDIAFGVFARARLGIPRNEQTQRAEGLALGVSLIFGKNSKQ